MRIFFVGPFPMPLHGFSFMNACVAAEFRRGGLEVIEFNVSPNGGFHLVLVFLRYLICLLQSFFSRTPVILYIGLSGGKRQLVDLLFFIFARIFFLRVIFHHHSFAYVNEPSLLSKFVFVFIKFSTHVVLSLDMGRRLSDIYGVNGLRVFSISNAFFIPEIQAPSLNLINYATDVDQEVVLGFISNITRDKGIFIFFDLLDHLSAAGLPFAAKIAGPVDDKIRGEFELRLSRCHSVEYLGPVYGSRKIEFFESIDYLIFPTIYKNEAEPVSIIEALAYGVPVAALSRGCIPDMLDSACGICVEDVGDLFGSIELEIGAILASRDILFEKSLRARIRFEMLINDSKANFIKLIDGF